MTEVTMIQMPLTKDEFRALITAAAVGATVMEETGSMREPSDRLVDMIVSLRRIVGQLSEKGWNRMTVRLERLGMAAWPELKPRKRPLEPEENLDIGDIIAKKAQRIRDRHNQLDLAVAEYVLITGKTSLSNISIVELLEWSQKQLQRSKDGTLTHEE